MGLHRVTSKGIEPAGAHLAALVTGARVVVDVGAGDGSYALHLAEARPDDVVVALDPAADNLRDTTKKANRRRLANLVLIRGAVEEVAGSPLEAAADEVHVILPWGRLLAGVVTDDVDVRAGLAALGRPGTRYRFVLNGEIWVENMPLDHETLPEPTPEYVADVVAPQLAARGIVVDEIRYLDATETKALRSTWAKKLSASRDHPRFLLVTATMQPTGQP